MTTTPDSETDADAMTIGDRMDRLETIAETLEAGNVDLETAKELRTEADDHFAVLRAELDVDGDLADGLAEAADSE